MSDNVPFVIQEEIIKRLPVKSLIRCRSVSKSWKSLIDSSDFITQYRSHQQHILVCNHRYGSEPKYVSIVDDNTFPEQRVSVTLPPLVKMLKSYRKIGSSHGLLCLYNDKRVVIWNPSIRKAVAVVVPNVVHDKKGVAVVVPNVVEDMIFNTELGFGVCRETIDPKIVKVTSIDRFPYMESVTSIPWQVEVFTLSTGEWRSPYGNLPRKSIVFGYQRGGVCVDGVCYWLATDTSTVYAGIQAYNMIISFDMTSEEFGEVNLPDSFVYRGPMWDLYIYNLRESLVLVECSGEVDYPVYNVWMMVDGVPKSFTKLYAIHESYATIYCVHEFRNSGELVMEVTDDEWNGLSLVVYEPNLRQTRNLGMSLWTNDVDKIYVHSYMETLLLLDQPSSMVFDKGKRYIESFKRSAKNKRLLKDTRK